MTSGWDVGALNDVYFVTIDAILSQAQRHGAEKMRRPQSNSVPVLSIQTQS